MANQPAPLLEARGVSKRFAGVQALDDVTVSIAPGEVLAVVGENGAGKSTLMKILAGVQPPSAGALFVDGNPVNFSGVHQALDAGVVLIHQELNLAPNLDIGANMFLGREPNKFGFIDKKAIAQGASGHLDRVGLDASPHERLSNLPIGKQQLVEIAKAISTGARVLIMDEPTSSLSQQEADRLYEVILQLKSEGVAIIYISHRLHEVTHLADRVVVLRDGQYVGELTDEKITRENIVPMMVGRDIQQFYHRVPHSPGDEILTANNLRTPAFPQQQVSFSLRAGEVVGLAGLVGAGRTELLTTLFGVTPAVGGQMQLRGAPFAPRQAATAIERGMALAPEDRRREGLILAAGARRNLSLVSLRDRLQSCGFVRRASERRMCEDLIERLGVKLGGLDLPVRTLSGGNQQKIVLGKWLAMEPGVLLLDEPTRGIDVGAKAEIYALIHQLAGQGMAVLFASSEMDEVIGLADRVIVMHQGAITGELSRDDLTEEEIMHLAVGGHATAAT